MLVRAATPADFAWIITQLPLFSEQYGQTKLFYNSEHSIDVLAHLAKDHLLLVAEHEIRGVVGFIGGFLHPHIFNPEIIQLTECLWWVDMKHRGTRAGFVLFEAFTTFGRENADWVCATLETHSPVKDEFLTKRGYVLRERSFVMEA